MTRGEVLIFNAVCVCIGLVLALMTGCAHQLPDPITFVAPPSGATEAEQLTWDQMAVANHPLPVVHWVGPTGLTCDDGTGFFADGSCDLGVHDEDSGEVYVALPTGAWTNDVTLTMVHELCHARSRILTGDGDGEHRRMPCFDPTMADPEGPLVLDTTGLLASMGY